MVFFTQLIVNLWNFLPLGVVNAGNLPGFKKTTGQVKKEKSIVDY